MRPQSRTCALNARADAARRKTELTGHVDLCATVEVYGADDGRILGSESTEKGLQPASHGGSEAFALVLARCRLCQLAARLGFFERHALTNPLASVVRQYVRRDGPDPGVEPLTVSQRGEPGLYPREGLLDEVVGVVGAPCPSLEPRAQTPGRGLPQRLNRHAVIGSVHGSIAAQQLGSQHEAAVPARLGASTTASRATKISHRTPEGSVAQKRERRA